MAVKLAKKNNQYNVQRRTFYIDSADDLTAVESEYDCGIGDLAELPDGTVYCRHSDGYDGDLWEKKGASGGSGGGGGGSSLPSVTDADVGKSLMVGRKAAGTYTVVPEQSITVSEQFAVIPNADTTHWVVGANATIVFDGDSYYAPVMEVDGDVGAEFDVGAVVYTPDMGLFVATSPGEHTIFVTVSAYTGEWNVDYPFMLVHDVNETLDRTYKEIMNAVVYENKVVFILRPQYKSIMLVSSFTQEAQFPYALYAVGADRNDESLTGTLVIGQKYVCNTMDDYPYVASE